MGRAAVQRDELDFIREISSADEMLISTPERYYGWGKSALGAIQASLHAGKVAGPPASILDLPCGHGRVLRMLKAAYPDARLTACDLNRDGVDFCARTFDANPVYSERDPREIQLDERYELIWVGSLLTHLDAERWHQFLAFFADHLVPGGVLVFTTHGHAIMDQIGRGERTFSIESVHELRAECLRTGFAYQDHTHRSSYGISLADPKWVRHELDLHPELTMTMYLEAGVNNAQDAVACQRSG